MTAPCTAAICIVGHTTESTVIVVVGSAPLWDPHTIGNTVINKTGSAPHCTDTALHTARICVIMAGSAPHCTDTALHTARICVIMAGSALHCTDTALHTARICVIMAGSVPHCTDTALHTGGSCVITGGSTVPHTAGNTRALISAGHDSLVLQPTCLSFLSFEVPALEFGFGDLLLVDSFQELADL